MKILVTGANGYIGQGVVKELLNSNNIIVATDIRTECIDSRAIVEKADLFTIDDPYEYFGKPDVLLHLAWRNGFVHNDMSHLEDLPKHYEFINKLITSGIKRVAVLGSMHEVGFYEGCIKEETPTNPMSLYGISKDALRQAVGLAVKDKGVAFQWIRGYYIVGNVEYGCSIFSKLALAEKEGKATFPFTTGQNQWDFLSYEETCQQIAAVVEQEKIQGIINVCSGKPEKLCDRVERFIRENNYKIRLEYGAFPDRPYDSKAVWGDDAKIREIMQTRLNDGI